MARRVEEEARPGALRVIEGTDDRPEIVVTLDQSDVTDKAAAVLANDGEIYQRGGSLVHVVAPTPAPGAKALPTIRELPVATLRVRLSQVARWVKIQAKGDYKRVIVPDAIVQAVHARGQWDAVRPLVSVLTAPTIRPDGTVLQRAGYDPSTALLLWPSDRFVEVPERVSQEEAIGAARAVLDLVCDFPFASEHDRSAWLAAVLTLVGRSAVAGPCPLFAVDANTRGSGKSRLVDVAAVLAHGTKAARSSLSLNDEEMRKQLSSLLAEGAPCALIDNVKAGARLGGASFDALLTSDVWKDRDLGKIRNLTLPARTVWWATGNNLRFAGDLPRRTLRIRLESPLEDPEDRTGFKHGEGDALLKHTARHRKFLVAQALMVLRAHAIAGRPRCGRSWGSFEPWSDVIASAVRWLGFPDPLEARATEDETADEERLYVSALLAALEDLNRPITARELLLELYPPGAYESERTPDLFPSYAAARDALEAATASKGTPDATRVGHFLKRVRGRIIDGACILGSLDPHRKIMVWTVRRTAPRKSGAS